MSVLMVNLFISFWMSPFIIRTIGVEANGFVTLASNFISYATLIEAAIGSMAGRFITIEYIRGDFAKANLYYNSVFWARLVILLTLVGPAVYFIIQIDSIVNVPERLLLDVRILFGLMFANFFCSLCTPQWNVAVFVVNKLHRSYIPTAFLTLFRAVALYTALTLLTPKVYYTSVASLVIFFITIYIQWYNKRLFASNLSLHLRKGKRIFSRKAIAELTSSGIWNSVSSIGNMLLSGLDILMCNIFLGPTAMGVLALSKSLPMQMQMLSATIRNAFGASITIEYAKGNMEMVYHELKRAMKMTSFLMIIPIAGIVTFGDWFFQLWVPSQDAHILQTLSVLGIVGYMFTSGTQILYCVFSVVNKVRPNSIAMLASGAVSISVMYILVKYTSIGIYVFGGVSMVINLTRNMSFTLPATARYLGFKWTRFYPQVGQTVIASIVLIAIGQIMKPLLSGESWTMFILSCIKYVLVVAPVSFFILFNRNERRYVLHSIYSKLKGKMQSFI